MNRFLHQTRCICLSACAIACFGCDNGGGETIKEGVSTPASSASLVCEPLEVQNKGEVAVGSRVSCTYTLRNETKVPLRLRISRITCSCIDVELEENRLDPGGETAVTVVADVRGVPGEQNHAVEFEGTPELDSAKESAPALPSLRCTAQMSFTPKFEYSIVPLSISAFVLADCSFERSIYLQAPDVSEGLLSGASCSIEGVTAGKPEVVTANAARAVFRGQFPYNSRPRTGWVEIRTASPTTPVCHIPISIVTLPACKIEPPGLVLGTGAENETTVEGAVRVTIPSDAGITINVTPEDGSLPEGVSVAGVTREGACWTVRITVDTGIAGSAGSAFFNVVDGDGRVLGDIPVAWLPDLPAPPR